MGLLSRFRTSNSNTSTSTSTKTNAGVNGNAIASSSTQHSNQNSRSITPPPAEVNTRDELTSPSRKLLRPTIPPPSPSSNSITSKISIPWKKNKGKEKEREKDNVGGIPYESTPLHIPSQHRTVSSPITPRVNGSSSQGKIPANQRRSTLLSFDPPPQPSSPLANSHRPLPDDDLLQDSQRGPEEHMIDHEDQAQFFEGQQGSNSRNRNNKVSSGQFRQVGGILGQLNFELDSSKSSPPEKWLRKSSNSNPPPIPSIPTITDPYNYPASQIHQDDNETSLDGLTPSITNESIVIINKDEILPQQFYQDLQPDTSQISTTQGSSNGHDQDYDDDIHNNRMELLESAEKKNKFWKRPRRSSKSHVETAENERSASPTPRRDSRNDTSLDLSTDRPSVDLNLPEPRPPRPQQLRRPSSSFFHNPFNRSVSRTSLALDAENAKNDEGSFQLRGFRHVSGMMEVEGAGELENYVTHFRGQPRSSISPADLLTSPVITTTEESQALSSPPLIQSPPPTSYTPRQYPPTFPLSRPTSIANSLASATGDDLVTVNKVSVAAFRKGIRRPSETLVTMSDVGHGSPRNVSSISNLHHSPFPSNAIENTSDDEDDVPLGLIKGKDMRREKSSQSLSSMRNIGDLLAAGTPSNDKRPATMFDSIERKPSPSVTPVRDDTSGMVKRQLSPEIIDRKNTPSPGTIERKYTPSPQLNPSSSVATPDISRKGSPALGTSRDIVRKPSPNPGLSFTVHRPKSRIGGHQRNGHGSGGSGFVVKSTRLTRDDLLPKNANMTGQLTPFQTPPTSGPSTPNPSRDESDHEVKAKSTPSPNLVNSPEEMSPIEGYFSHLAPYIAEQPIQSTSKLSISPPPTSRHSPNHHAPAPGPPIVPLPVPQPGDKTSVSLNLPLPPDQMPDTPPKNPSELPDADKSLSPGTRRKKLSLLDEPIRVLSGLWNSPQNNDDGFDPALVLTSMDALGGEDTEDKNESGQPSQTNVKVATSRTSATDLNEKVRSPLSERLAGIASSANPHNVSKPSLTRIRTSNNDSQDDGYSTERMESPISASTSTITVPPPASPSHSSNIHTARPAPRETFTSSFARARKPSKKNDDSEDSDEESESESATCESTNTTPQAKIQARVKNNFSTANSKGKDKLNSPTNTERKVPHGPRKPSVKDRKRVSSMFSTTTTTQPISHAKQDENDEEDDEKPLGILRNKPSKSSLVSSTNNTRRPIAKSPSISNIGSVPRPESHLGFTLTTRSAKRDESGLGQRPKTLLELGPIVQPLKDRSTNHATSPTTTTSTTGFNGSSDPGRPQSRVQVSSQSQRPPSSASASSRPTNPPSNDRKKSYTANTPIMKRSPAQTLIKLPSDTSVSGLTNNGNRKTASPDSSRSATTGGSVNYQPMTPKDSNDSKRLQKDQLPSMGKGMVNDKQLTYNDQIAGEQGVQIDHQRQRSYSSIDPNQNQYQPPNYGNQNQWNANRNMNMPMPVNMGMGFDQNQMGMMPQMGMGMGGMSPEAMHNMMKQQWQMQFMAAAFRASEEEWEKASCVSGHTNRTVPASFGGQQAYQPMSSMGWNGPMGQYPNSMGMNGYGFPPQGMFPNQPYGYQMPPASPGPGMTPFGGGGGGGGMYSYGTSGGVGAQSVFGGEFGPPPITPSQRFMNGSSHQGPIPPLPTSSSSQNLLKANASNNGQRERGRRGSTSQSVYMPSNLSSGINATTTQNTTPSSPGPPSSWSRRSDSGDWSDLTQNQNQYQVRKTRPQTQFIN